MKGVTKEDRKLAKDFLDAITDRVKIEKNIHKGYSEWVEAGSRLKGYKPKNKREAKVVKRMLNRKYFGKYHYIYKNSKGEISLIRVLTGYPGKLSWEIYSGNKLFEDTINFLYKEDAEKAIYKYLGDKKHGKSI